MMRKAHAWMWVMTLSMALIIAGCSSGSGNNRSTGAAETSVKTMDDYRSAAEKEITEDNAQKELEKIEKEIDADQ